MHCADGLINGPIKDRINKDVELPLQSMSRQEISMQQLCFEMMIRQFAFFSYHWFLLVYWSDLWSVRWWWSAHVLNHSPIIFRKFLYSSIFDIWRWVSTYFSMLIPNHPTWRRVKMQPWEVIGEKLIFVWSRDQCSAKRMKKPYFSVWLGLLLGLGQWYGSGGRLGLG